MGWRRWVLFRLLHQIKWGEIRRIVAPLALIEISLSSCRARVPALDLSRLIRSRPWDPMGICAVSSVAPQRRPEKLPGRLIRSWMLLPFKMIFISTLWIGHLIMY